MFAWNFFKSPFCSWSCSGCCGNCPLLHLLQQPLLLPTPAHNRRKGMQVLLLGLRQERVKSTWATTADRPQSCMTKWLANREAIHRWRWRWWRRRRRRRRRWKWRCNLVKRVLNSKGTYKSRKWIGLVHNLTNILNSNNNNINIKMPVSKELAQWSCMFFMQ